MDLTTGAEWESLNTQVIKAAVARSELWAIASPPNDGSAQSQNLKLYTGQTFDQFDDYNLKAKEVAVGFDGTVAIIELESNPNYYRGYSVQVKKSGDFTNFYNYPNHPEKIRVDPYG